jgi:tetratricopeptide (TPR) repeat protein
MPDRSSRSLIASSQGIQKAKLARQKIAISNSVLSETWGMSRQVLHNFFVGKGIDRENFIKICQNLNLNWQDITLPPAENQKTTELKEATKLTPINGDYGFVGRDLEISQLGAIEKLGEKVIFIWGEGGVGKTKLARYFLQQEFGSNILNFDIAREAHNLTALESLVQEKLLQIGIEPSMEFGICLERLKQKLKQERIGILIDNLETTLVNGKFNKLHRSYIDLLVALSDPSLQSVTLITSRERLSESRLTMRMYQLKGLGIQAWQCFFGSQGITLDDFVLTVLTEMHTAYGGNAKVMASICGEILTDCDRNISTYWQKHGKDLLAKKDIADLISTQFDRLQTTEPNCYKLLYRLGCYRYQDVPTVSLEGLFALLWDVGKGKIKLVESLRDRALLDSHKGQYYLHPVVVAEAVSRLRATSEWIEANCKAAEFWGKSTVKIRSVEDAVTALEAYHHYIAIDDFDQAIQVILEQHLKWDRGEFLDRSFHVLKTLLQRASVVNDIERVKSGYPLSQFCSVIGDAYWATGYLEKSITFHEKSRSVAVEHIPIASISGNSEEVWQLKTLEIAGIFNVALCQIDLGEVTSAAALFESALAKSRAIDPCRWVVPSVFCLAYTYSYSHDLRLQHKALDLADSVSMASSEQYQGLNMWTIGYRPLFVGLVYKNLGRIEQAFAMYNHALTMAEIIQHPQLRGRTLTGLAELHRGQQNFDVALSHHIESVEILDGIGAKCDLAEAYFQLALTYQALNHPSSQEKFEKSIQLFSELKAVKQVERVRSHTAS